MKLNFITKLYQESWEVWLYKCKFNLELWSINIWTINMGTIINFLLFMKRWFACCAQYNDYLFIYTSKLITRQNEADKLSTELLQNVSWLLMYLGMTFKAILRDVMGDEKFYLSLFPSYIYVMTLVVTVF